MGKKRLESVWDYPRPPRVEVYTGLIEVHHGGYVLAKSSSAYRVLETSHPPVFYIPPADIMMELLRKTGRTTSCEFKGPAVYYDLEAPGLNIESVVFYPSKLDACCVDGEKVKPQEGDFYGGWITAKIKGPFKGRPGTRGQAFNY